MARYRSHKEPAPAKVETTFVGRAKLPWSPTRPLLFHVLTGAPHSAEGDDELCERIAAKGSLRPYADRQVEEFERRTDFAEIDLAAGDGRWLFFSVGRTYSPETDYDRAALAFYADELLALPGPKGWRHRDLVIEYERIAKSVKDGNERGRRLREYAERMTRTQPEMIRMMIGAEVERLSLAGDEEGQERLEERVSGLIHRTKYRRGEREGDESWERDYDDDTAHLMMSPWYRSLRPAKSPFGGIGRWPDALTTPGFAEVLVGTNVPLSLAAYCRSAAAGRWYTRDAFVAKACR